MWKVIVTTYLVDEGKYLSHVAVFPKIELALSFVDRIHAAEMHIVNAVITAVTSSS